MTHAILRCLLQPLRLIHFTTRTKPACLNKPLLILRRTFSKTSTRQRYKLPILPRRRTAPANVAYRKRIGPTRCTYTSQSAHPHHSTPFLNRLEHSSNSYKRLYPQPHLNSAPRTAIRNFHTTRQNSANPLQKIKVHRFPSAGGGGKLGIGDKPGAGNKSGTGNKPGSEWSWQDEGKYNYQQGSNRYQSRGRNESEEFARRLVYSRSFPFVACGLGVCVAGFWMYNVETVPYSGRRRFNIISPALEASLGQQSYEQTLQQFRNSILPPHDPRVQQVQRVIRRLLSANNLDKPTPGDYSGAEEKWTINVIESRQSNAFVVPGENSGGHVFVFTGILRDTQNDNGLATVLSHEIAHNLAHHLAEGMSLSAVLRLPVLIGWFVFGIDPYVSGIFTTLGIQNPGSRRQESEADSIGLTLLAKACYDPTEAVRFWDRMDARARDEGTDIPQFLSTHPSHGSRRQSILELLPRAEEVGREAGCERTRGFMDGFREFSESREEDDGDVWGRW